MGSFRFRRLIQIQGDHSDLGGSFRLVWSIQMGGGSFRFAVSVVEVKCLSASKLSEAKLQK